MRMRRVLAFLPLIAAGLSSLAFSQIREPTFSPTSVDLPPWQRLLNKEDARTAGELQNHSLVLVFQDHPEEAIAAARSLVRLREKVQGADHWESIDAREHLDTIIYLTKVEFARRAFGASIRLLLEAVNRRAAGHRDEAEKAYTQYVQIHEQIFGEDHVRTARAYFAALELVERPSEEEQYQRKALRIVRRILGEDHPDTAGAYALLARNLNAQDRSFEAEPLDRNALLIRRRVLGEENHLTIQSYINHAFCLLNQGRTAEAEIAYRRVLAISRRGLGGDHRRTALAYDNLGGCLYEQGRLLEAYEAFERALAIQRKLLGENHTETIGSYMNVAGILDDLGQSARSEERYRQVLDILQTTPNAPYVRTAQTLKGLALTLERQGKSPEAERLLRKSLDIFRNALGTDYPQTASCSRDLALLLSDRGTRQAAEAEEECRRALATHENVLGRSHPQTAISLHVLARIQMARGRSEEAEATLTLAAGLFPRIRTAAVRPGLDGAAWMRSHSPFEMLAAVLARNGKPSQAWERFEQSLGRSTWDEIVARGLISPEAHHQFGRLRLELNQLDQAIERMGQVKRTANAQASWTKLQARRQSVQETVDRLADHMLQSQGFPAGGSFPIKRVQASLSVNEAFVAWIDLALERGKPDGEHWVVVLRARGVPIWIRLNGSGVDGAWTRDDLRLSALFSQELVHPMVSKDSKINDVIRRLTAQRVAPLRRFLGAGDGLPAVTHLIVLPSPLMAGLPIELLVEDMTVSYAPSATVTTYLRDLPPPNSQGLLALGDPIFEEARPSSGPESLPAHGLLLMMIAPNSNAAKARPIRLARDDVLLSYNNIPLHRIEDLDRAILQPGQPEFVQLKVWRRNGILPATEVPSGPLGVVINGEPAPEAIRKRQNVEALTRSTPPLRGPARLDPLPGSRAEVESVASLFAAHGWPASILLNSEASEQRLETIVQNGELARWRHIIFSTHSDINTKQPLQSAIILSQDNLPDPLARLYEGAGAFDGRLTAEEILFAWRLDADLVTLSACRSGLGKHEIGEGFVGFSQSFLIAGSRSVCLSLWNADDAGTALLMTRFYQNLLGRRVGLDAPMSKIAALTEAKRWLRTLPRSEALSVLGTLTKGMARDIGRKLRPLNPEILGDPPSEAKDDGPPFAHPYYWSAFVLVGNTN